jgi:protoheme IX farnesyltransferase
MLRTARRATATGSISTAQVLALSGLLGGVGMVVLYRWVNPLTMWLTFATFVGYAVIYTIILKPRTPQNIVIGGLSGAMPPALGWAAIADSVPAEAWLLVLIIFIWTPPHFWALALYRTNDYAKSGLPMLPITHGQQFTRLHILLYSIALLATTLLPYVVGMSGWLYLIAAVALGVMFVHYAYKLFRVYSDELARTLFRFSILYLSLLFAALLADHWLIMVPR